MAGALKIQTLAQRVFLEIEAGDTRAWVEMDLGEAKHVMAILSRAIGHVESGASVAVSFDEFMRSRLCATAP